MSVRASSAQIYLASSSPRRKALLDQIGVKYLVIPVECDERLLPTETTSAGALRLALDKARAGRQAVQHMLPRPVLAADTLIDLGGCALGKPSAPEEAMEMLEALSGRTHEVLTAVAVAADRELTVLSTSRVTFRRLSERECRAYCGTGEGIGKAGGYAVQGHAAVFIERIEGSYSGIMGLPLYETAEMLATFGIRAL